MLDAGVEMREGWLWPKGDIDTWPTVWQEVREEMPVILSLVPHKGVCVQAGGNGGLWVRPLAEAFETVYTFEPDALCFRCLVHNVTEPNIIKMQAALGDRHQMIAVDKWCGERNHGAQRIDIGKGAVPMLRIDDLALPRLDLLQLDIEGAEGLALDGARYSIAAYKPVIVLELRNHAQRYGHTDQDIRNILVGMGYRMHQRICHDEIFLPA